MKQSLPVTAVALLMFAIIGSAQPAQFEIERPCNVTLSEKDNYGNRLLSVFGLWPDGTVVFRPGGAGFITSDRSLGMKFGWMRGVSGPLKITGHRLDGDAPPLRALIPDGYGELGFQATALVFPTLGCWRVNAQIGDLVDSKLTFVTKVVKIGDGRAWRRD